MRPVRCVTVSFVGLQQVGIFRLSADTIELAKLKDALVAGKKNYEKRKFLNKKACHLFSVDFSRTPDLSDYNIHTVACAMKFLLRDLKEPLLTFKLYYAWIAAGKFFVDKMFGCFF